MAGDDELDRLRERFVEPLVAQKTLIALQRLLSIAAVKRFIDDTGDVEQAKEDFEALLPDLEPRQDLDVYRWPVEDWVDRFNLYYTREIVDAHAAHDLESPDDVRGFVKDRIKELEDEFDGNGAMETKAYMKHAFVKELFWRLTQRFDAVTDPRTGESLPLSFDPAESNGSGVEYVGEHHLRRVVAWPEDYEAFLEAKNDAVEVEDMMDEDERRAMHDLPTVDDEKKSSDATESTSKNSKTDTRTTSETGTGTEEP